MGPQPPEVARVQRSGSVRPTACFLWAERTQQNDIGFVAFCGDSPRKGSDWGERALARDKKIPHPEENRVGDGRPWIAYRQAPEGAERAPQ